MFFYSPILPVHHLIFVKMKTKINLSILLVIILFTGISKANTTDINVTSVGKISGNIRNATSGLPLEFVTISLFSTTDSSMVPGTNSDQFGNFYISMLAPGQYYIVVSETGFEKREINQLKILIDNAGINLGEVMLKPACEMRRKHKNHK